MLSLKALLIVLLLTIVFTPNRSSIKNTANQLVNTPIATVQPIKNSLVRFIPEIGDTDKITTVAELKAVLPKNIVLVQNDYLGRGDASWYSADLYGPQNFPHPNTTLEARVIGEKITDIVVSYGSTGSDFDLITWSRVNPINLLADYGNPSDIKILFSEGLMVEFFTWEQSHVAVSYSYRSAYTADAKFLSFCFTHHVQAFFSWAVPDGSSVTEHTLTAFKERFDLRLFMPEAKTFQAGMLDGITTIEDFVKAIREEKCFQSPLSFWMN